MNSNQVSIFNAPYSLTDIFEGGNKSYDIFMPDHGMDNIESLQFLLDFAGVSSDNIIADYQTEVIIESGDQWAIISSYGNGDFFHHGYDVEILSLKDIRKIKLQQIEKTV